MKRFLISMAALLAVVGCAKQEDLVSANFATGPEFSVGIDATRVAVAEDGEGYSLCWTAGDNVSVFFNEGGNSLYRYAGETGSASGKIVSVEVEDGLELDTYYAVYPYNEATELNGDVLTLTLPAEQSYAKNSFGLGANTMVAKTTGEDKKNFEFKNLCGYVRVKVYGGMMIKSITLKGNSDEVLSGEATYDATNDKLDITGDGKTVTLDCGAGVIVGDTEANATTFWLVVPPTNFEAGFTIVLTANDGTTIEKKVESAFEVKRNTVHSSEAIKWEDKNVIFDAKFNLDGTATDAGRFGLAIEPVTDADGNTPYMTVFEDPTYQHGNVVAFNRLPGTTNPVYYDSFYFIDYSAESATNEEFKEALSDGFTMEIVAKKANHTSGDWMKAAGTNTFFLNFMATQQSNKIGVPGYAAVHNEEVAWAPGGEDHFGDFGYIPELGLYDHYLAVYERAENPDTEEVKHYVRLYVNGEYKGQHEDEVGHGNRMAIGGYPTIVDGVAGVYQSFSGVVAMVRILDNVSDLTVDEETGDVAPTANFAKARYEALNLPKVEAQTIGKPLFDAQFGENGAATNVGSMTGLVITPKLGETVTTTKRGDVYVATFNNDPAAADNQNVQDGFYFVDYSQNDAFKNNIKDGFTMELLCRSVSYAGNYWAKPFAASTFYIHHDWMRGSKWSFAGNTAENNWLSYGSTGAWAWYTPVTVGAYDHILLTYEAGGFFVMTVNGERVASRFAGSNKDFNPGSALALGGLPYTDGTVAHPFVGDIAIARIYNETFTQTQATARYTELQPTIQALNEASEEEMELILDVEFTADNKAKDKVNNYTITTETTGAGGNLTVSANGVATFGDDYDNITYFQIDLAQGDGSLKTSMNNGFTIETILASPQANYESWGCPFGGEGFSLVRLGSRWGAGWNINGWDTENAWKYADGSVRPTAEQYYHVLYIYDALSGQMSVYRDGVYDQKSTLGFAMRENSTMVIGARLHEDGVTAENPWGGDIVTFKVYEQAADVMQVATLYEASKEAVKKANSAGLGLLVDVQFNDNGTATDKVKGYAITTEKIGEGGTLVVNNGIVTLGDSDDNMSYYKIDLAQGDGALKTSMNNGFTIETILASPNNNPGWAGAFGGEGFSLLRLHAWGYKWNINGWEPSGTWRYTDGTIAPVANQYYHILYSYNAQTGQLDVYRNGVCENKNQNFNFVMRENLTVVIGARNDSGVVKQSWLGNMATFAIYEKPSTAAYAEIRYAEVKAQVDALNGVTE